MAPRGLHSTKRPCREQQPKSLRGRERRGLASVLERALATDRECHSLPSDARVPPSYPPALLPSLLPYLPRGASEGNGGPPLHIPVARPPVLRCCCARRAAAALVAAESPPPPPASAV
eukprot:81398-Chlamydomonas_euryale.AAC.1